MAQSIPLGKLAKAVITEIFKDPTHESKIIARSTGEVQVVKPGDQEASDAGARQREPARR